MYYESFNYPLDVKYLLRKKRSLKKQLLAENRDFVSKNIAVLGGSTTNEVVDQLELFLLHHGIKPSFYQSEYGRFWEDGVFDNPELDDFSPDIIYIHTNWRNILSFPEIQDTDEEVIQKLDGEFQRFQTLWEAVENKYHCPIIQNNMERPNYRLMGNRDVWDIHGRTSFIHRFNEKLYEYANGQKNFYINDLDYIAQDYGISAWNDTSYWSMYKYICPLDAIPYIAQSVSNIIKAIYGKNKKALVLDLDNTLWGGVIGDEGVEGIQIGEELPGGQAYSEFQKYCKQLKDIGVVLAVDSKNDEDNALAGLNHLDGTLRPDDFVCIKANWNPKDQNLLDIASELTLGVDSFVFVDDNPAEREIVRTQVPGVAVPDMDRVENYIKILDHEGCFETVAISEEDLKKTQQYKAKADAKKFQSQFQNYEEYLDSLEMKATITEFKADSVQRIAQLTNKSNQFNLTTLRCTEHDIRNMQEDNNFICVAARLEDKFGDNGIVSVVAGEIVGKKLHVRLWLMSCRVLKRGLEDALMNLLFEKVAEKNIDSIIGYYYPTQKNNMVKSFYKDMGFEQIDEAGECWELNVSEYQKKDIHMLVEIEGEI